MELCLSITFYLRRQYGLKPNRRQSNIRGYEKGLILLCIEHLKIKNIVMNKIN
jgi:hypothetical protein